MSAVHSIQNHKRVRRGGYSLYIYYSRLVIKQVYTQYKIIREFDLFSYRRGGYSLYIYIYYSRLVIKTSLHMEHIYIIRFNRSSRILFSYRRVGYGLYIYYSRLDSKQVYIRNTIM